MLTLLQIIDRMFYLGYSEDEIRQALGMEIRQALRMLEAKEITLVELIDSLKDMER